MLTYLTYLTYHTCLTYLTYFTDLPNLLTSLTLLTLLTLLMINFSVARVFEAANFTVCFSFFCVSRSGEISRRPRRDWMLLTVSRK